MTLRKMFRQVRVSPQCHWATLCTTADPVRIRAQFPPNTVFVSTAMGPPRMHFDHGMYTITVPLEKYTYDAFTLALNMLNHLNAVIPLDMVVVMPFGPTTYFTALQMRDAWNDSGDTIIWTPLATDIWTPPMKK